MDDDKPPPLVFANQVIELLASHLFGDSVKVSRKGYRVIRVTFRRLGGSWLELCLGSPRDIELLLECVEAWGSRADR
jgi:hypothetical protein